MERSRKQNLKVPHLQTSEPCPQGLLGSNPGAGVGLNMEEIKKFIENHVNRIKPLVKKIRLAYWNATITGNEDFYKEYEGLQKKLERIYNNKKEFELVKGFLSTEVKEPLLKRQIKILYHAYLGSQGEIKLIDKIIKRAAELEQKFNTYRAKINNKEYTDNEIKDILKTEKNSKKLQEAWEASKRQGELVEKELVELIKLRNKLARNLGYKNYYLLSLEINEQKEQEITRIFDELDKKTLSSFKKIKKEMDDYLILRYQTKKLKPWHYQDLFFQEGPKIYKIDLDKIYNKSILEIANKFYNSINLAINDVLMRSDLYEKPGKYQHAYCIAIDREGDIRILENIKNNESWMETTLHELGHAVYSKFIDRGLPYLLKDSAHTLTTEAIALLFGRQSKNLKFIKTHCQVKEDNQLAEKLKKSLRLRQLIFLRWSQVMFNFEKRLYKNPNQDLNKLWWGLVKKFQLIDFSRDNPDWASKIHLVSSPVYYHNYLLGELLASQLTHHIKEMFNQDSYQLIFTKQIGNYLKNKVFMPGAKYEWQELIKKATNENLTPKYYIEQFCSH